MTANLAACEWLPSTADSTKRIGLSPSIRGISRSRFSLQMGRQSFTVASVEGSFAHRSGHATKASTGSPLAEARPKRILKKGERPQLGSSNERFFYQLRKTRKRRGQPGSHLRRPRRQGTPNPLHEQMGHGLPYIARRQVAGLYRALQCIRRPLCRHEPLHPRWTQRQNLAHRSSQPRGGHLNPLLGR